MRSESNTTRDERPSGFDKSKLYISPSGTSQLWDFALWFKKGAQYDAVVAKWHRPRHTLGGARGDGLRSDPIRTIPIAQRGYYQGAIDGVIGSASREAIRAFQAAQGLPVTGVIDRKVLTALGISYKSA
jgi:peptidoglycan hydrolase-like protein with peptidoglycan-binding domain